MASAQGRSLLPAVILRRRATLLSCRSPSTRSTIVLRCILRGRLALDPQIFQERLELALEPSSTVGAGNADLDTCEGDVFRGRVREAFAASLLCLRKRMNLKRVKSSTHSLAYRLPLRDVT